jgi:FMN reductase
VTEPLALVVVSAGAGDPSSTRLLAERTAARVTAVAGERGHEVHRTTIDLRELATEITSALTSRLVGPRLARAVAALREADGVIAGTPVYKAGASGLFTSFFQVLDDDLLIAKPVVLAATAGTARHALVVDDQLRALFAYLRALPMPTSLFAAGEDWNDPALGSRVDRAALELVLLLESGFARQVKDASWHRYQHEYGGAGGAEYSVDLDSDLMKVAAGGSLASGGATGELAHGQRRETDLPVS